MAYLVTGAAGFIGCNNVRALNAAGITDVIAVDNLTRSDKFVNLTTCTISDYFDKVDFIARVRAGKAPKPEAIFHQGACSDTMQGDGRYMMDNNYRYTLELFEWAQTLKIPFIYASSAATYGPGPVFVEYVRYEHPLNVYGYSKYLFDQFTPFQLDLDQPFLNGRRIVACQHLVCGGQLPFSILDEGIEIGAWNAKGHVIIPWNEPLMSDCPQHGTTQHIIRNVMLVTKLVETGCNLQQDLMTFCHINSS